MNRILIFMLGLILAFSLSLPARAAAICYSSDEMEAEQGMRLQNELLLVGMACGKAQNYRSFIEAHNDLWQDYEETLQKFFQDKNGMSQTAAKNNVSDFKVKFVNETGLRMAQISKPLFCRMHLKSFEDIKSKTNEEIRIKLRTAKPHQAPAYPACAE